MLFFEPINQNIFFFYYMFEYLLKSTLHFVSHIVCFIEEYPCQ